MYKTFTLITANSNSAYNFVGPRWSTSVSGIATSAKSSGFAARWESGPALLISANFLSPPENRRKEKSQLLFHHKYELWQLRFLGRIVNRFHNNMQAGHPLLIQFCRKIKTSKFMSREDTHLIPSYLALASWSLLVNGQTTSWCFVARLPSHTLVIFKK